MKLSSAEASDFEKIKPLFTQVFSDSEGEAEGLLVGNLAADLMSTTDAGDIHIYKAVEDTQLIGCIIFTRLIFDSKPNAFLLSPVAVHSAHQGQGVAQKLISFGINDLKEKNVELLFTYGDPSFYSKVGFVAIDESIAKAPFKLSQPEGWLGQSLITQTMPTISGPSYCAKGLSKPEYW